MVHEIENILLLLLVPELEKMDILLGQGVEFVLDVGRGY